MISIQFKAKHLYLITHFLKDYPAGQYFSLLNRIKDITIGVIDEDIVSIYVSIEEVINVYSILTLKPEGQLNTINTEMSEILSTQIQQNINDPLWMELATKITDLRTSNLSIADNYIQSGKQFLFN